MSDELISPAELEAIRKRQGWTPEQAAQWAGASPEDWRQWEQGGKKPPIMLGRLIEASRKLVEFEGELVETKRCQACLRSYREVRQLISMGGSRTQEGGLIHFICDECVEKAVEIIDEQRTQNRAARAALRNGGSEDAQHPTAKDSAAHGPSPNRGRSGRRQRDVRLLYCSFCEKNQHEVRKLIAGPSDVFICDGCVELCNDIIHEELAADASDKSR